MYQFSDKTTKSGFSIKLGEKVSVVHVTCSFNSFDDKLLDEIKTCAKPHSSVNAGLLTSKCP